MKIFYIILAFTFFNSTILGIEMYQITITFDNDAVATKYAVLYSYKKKEFEIKEIKNRKVQFSGALTSDPAIEYERGLIILTNKADYNSLDLKKGLIDSNSISVLLEPSCNLIVNKIYAKSTSSGKLNDVLAEFKKIELKYSDLWKRQIDRINKLNKELATTTSQKIRISKQNEIAEIKSNQIFVDSREKAKELLMVVNNNLNTSVAFAKLIGYSRAKIFPVYDVKNTFSNFSLEYRNSEKGKLVEENIKKRIDLERGDLNVGEVAPSFKALNVNNKEVKLADFKGQYVLIDFWASWCAPCRTELPILIKAKEQNKNLAVITVSFDNNSSKWKAAITQDKISGFVNLIDVIGFNSEIAKLYSIRFIPQNYLIDKNGKIIAKNIYGNELKGMLIDKKLSD